MEGPNSYLPDDLVYDDLMANSGWPAPTDQQYSYPQQEAPDAYGRYSATHQSYDQFTLSQQPQYPQATYSNSPYTSQYQQHARPSDVFGPNSFDVDSSLSGAPSYHSHESSFSFDPHSHTLESATISPQSLQYSVPQSQTMSRSVSASNPQRQQNGLGNFYNQRTQSPALAYYNSAPNDSFQPAQLVDSNVQCQNPPNNIGGGAKQDVEKAVDDPVQSVQLITPRAQQTRVAPNTLRITHPEMHSESAVIKNRFEYAPFLAWEDTALVVPSGLKTTLPKYHPRRSKSGKNLVPGLDLSVLIPAGIPKRRSRPPKIKASTSGYQGTSGGPKPVIVNKLRDDGNSGANSPSTVTETSSSEEESSSEESEYEEDEEIPSQDISEIRGNIRPSSIPEGTRWDAIGIIWKDPNSSPSKEAITDAVLAYGNFISALRVQIKANSTKTEEAAARPAEVQRLKRERVILSDSLYQAIDAANVYGYGPIVDNLGGNHKLVNGLTTTLIECNKENDHQSKLPKAIFSLLAKFQNMTDDLLKRLKFDGIQKRWVKKGDEETKKDIVTILANTIDAKEKATKAKKEPEQAEYPKKMREKSDPPKTRNAEIALPPTKRAHEGDSSNGKANKKFALDTASTVNPSAKPIPIKRSGVNLLGIASRPIAKAIPKKREPSSPTESKLGAILASIAKPPELPKAPIAPPRAPETPEEKAKRERKESRRHLRVKFKVGSELEEIRLFKHEQAEDEGRQDEMLRDAHDDRLEGMMHKQRVSETMDEDEEYQPSEADLPYPEPIEINFSQLVKSSPFGPTYTTRGGSVPVVTAEQKTQQRREGLELMVIYTDPSDIPPTAKEPHQNNHGTDGTIDYEPERDIKLPTEPWMVQRLNEIYQYGPEQASQIALSRQSEQQWKARDRTRPPVPATHPLNNVSSALHQLVGPVQRPVAQAQQAIQVPSIVDQNAADEIYAQLSGIVAYLKGLPYPAVEPPQWLTDLNKRDEWVRGLARDNAAKQARAQAEAAKLQAAFYQQPQAHMMTAQYSQQVPAPPVSYMHPANSAGQNPRDDIAQQVQSYLAAYQNGDNNALQPQQFDYNSWALNSTGQEQSGHAEQQRWDPSWGNEDSKNHSQDKSLGNKSKRGFDMTMVDSPFGEDGEYMGKKKPGRFYRDAKGVKGPKCT
ncbi:unnamed protein product [Diplocarpon coronariae]|uniref:Uncharacterized protein n=1 Tax=Diplocarpon coronariae TaxID=2795749 RepID=A0A218YYE9_9HELO|nr:hypothetical protein JHW43_007191 [Diplocarpon mali]OWP00363.1 hypothetical protein B2J93_3913 [Marssonina coronariae]